MNRTNQILVVVLILQVALVAVVRLADTKPVVSTLEAIVSVDSAAVDKIEIYDKLSGDSAATSAATTNSAATSEKAKIVLEKTGDSWKLSSHYNYPAMTSKVDELLTKISNMKAREPVATSKTRHRQLRVAKDKYERRIIVSSGGKTTEFYLGTSAGRQQTAVRIKGDERTFGVTGITTYAASVSPTSWIDTNYFTAEGDTQSMKVTNAHGAFLFKRDDGASSWKHVRAGDVASGDNQDGSAPVEVNPPKGKELDEGRIVGLSSKVRALRLAEPADPALLTNEPIATVTFNTGDKNHVLKIGAEVSGKYPVRLDEGRPVLITKATLDDIVNLSTETLYREPPKPGEKPSAPPAGRPQLPPGFPQGGLPPMPQ